MYQYADALRSYGPNYYPLACSAYDEVAALLGNNADRRHMEASAEETEANELLLHGALFNRAIIDCMRTTVPKNVQTRYDSKYGRSIPPELILKTYYKAGAIKKLLGLADQFPESSFAPAALKQVSILYSLLNKPSKAQEVDIRLLAEYPDSAAQGGNGIDEAAALTAKF